jgi:hypothetical protein
VKRWWWRLWDFLFPKPVGQTAKGISMAKYLQNKINNVKQPIVEHYENIIDGWNTEEFKLFCAIYGIGIERRDCACGTEKM